MTKSMMVAAVLAVVAVAGPALAHGKRGGEYHDLRRDHMIKKFDQDGDGRLSRAERTAAVQAVFKAADSDGDGGLSLAEWEAYREKRLAAWRQAVHSDDRCRWRWGYQRQRVCRRPSRLSSPPPSPRLTAPHRRGLGFNGGK